MTLSPSRILALLCCSFAGGVFLFTFASPPFWAAAAVLGAGAAGLLGGKNSGKVLVCALAVLAAAAGAGRAADALSRVNAPHGEEAVVSGEVSAVSFGRGGSVRFTASGPEGTFRVVSFSGMEVETGRQAAVHGVLEETDPARARVLAKDGIDGIILASRIKDLGPGGWWSRARASLRSSLDRLLPASESMLAGAIVLGDKGGMSPELKDTLNRAGVRHVTAISGLHVAVVLVSVRSLLLALGIRRALSSAGALGAVFLFVALAGFQASAVRAGIMGALAAGAASGGSREAGLKRLAVAAAVMLAANPLLFRYDPGFQLSFLAVFGIILLLPSFSLLLSRVPQAGGLRESVGMSLSAQLAVLPLQAALFQSVPLASVPATALIVPLLPAILALGMAAAAAGSIAPVLALAFAVPLESVLWIALHAARLFSAFPVLSAVSAWGALWVSLCAGAFVLAAARRRRACAEPVI